MRFRHPLVFVLSWAVLGRGELPGGWLSAGSTSTAGVLAMASARCMSAMTCAFPDEASTGSVVVRSVVAAKVSASSLAAAFLAALDLVSSACKAT